jgi:hypothetical protein
MKKIDESFRTQILKQPNKLHKIVVVCKSNIAPDKFNLKVIPGLDNCFTGLLTGQNILALEKSAQVISIEPDGEMSAL